MKAQHGKDTPKLKGNCPSCGVNFSDHMGLVGTCAELQGFKGRKPLPPIWDVVEKLGAATIENERLSEELQKFKPILMADRTPAANDMPCLIWDDLFNGWRAVHFPLPLFVKWWMPMPPKPE